jgi:hypothetical protein
VGHEALVELTGRGVHALAVDLDEREAGRVEEHQGVEEVEEHGGVGHQSGFRAA